MMNLVYACVFYNEDYLKLLELLLASIKMYSSKDTFQILVLTSPEFKDRLNDFSSRIDLNIQVMCVKLTSMFDAACARLRIFDYTDISKYENILYLDTDIIIKGDLAPIFSLATQDKLYGIEQGTIASNNFGKQFFKTSGVDFNTRGINSGTLLFKNCLAIRDLFSRIRGHIDAFTDSGQPHPYTMDQPFINYHAIQGSIYDNTAMNPYVSLYEQGDAVANYTTSVVCHFSFPIGNFAHKYGRMKAFFLGLLNINTGSIPSPKSRIDFMICEDRLTLLDPPRLYNVFNQCVKFQGTGYSFVECGVARGGALALMKYASTNNPVYGFDSFEGMPDITEKDLGEYNKSDPLTGFGKVGDNLSGGIETVYRTFNAVNVPMDNVHLVKGFFNDTLAPNKEKCGKIAVLRIDADWYESCKICLEELYDQVVDGGIIISDDYGHFIGAKRAFDEFRESRGITSPLIQTDYCEFFWIKGANTNNNSAIVGKKYTWGAGFIQFTETHLETTWGQGGYLVKDSKTVLVDWKRFYHIIRFNEDYTGFTSIRISPDDFYIGMHTITA